jgi:2-oxoglutarate ferredoxin oxidoreductase subunit gamma
VQEQQYDGMLVLPAGLPDEGQAEYVAPNVAAFKLISVLERAVNNVVVADRTIAYPFVQKANIFVALSQEAYTRYRPEAGPEAQVLIDSGLVVPDESDTVHPFPATELAEELGRRIVANVLMLGFLSAQTGVVKVESLEQAIRTTVKEKVVPLNLKALQRGYSYKVEEAF